MGLSANVSGAWQSVTPYANVNGTWQAIQNAYANVNGTWQQIFKAYVAVSATGPGTVGGSCNNHQSNNSPCTAQAIATVVPAGGNGSYSYTWSFVSGVVLGLSGQGTATATFSDTKNAANQTENSVYQCVVSDGITSATVTVTVNLTFDNAL